MARHGEPDWSRRSVPGDVAAGVAARVVSSLEAGRQLYQRRPSLAAGSLSGLVSLLMLARLPVSYAQKGAPSGEELYIDRLGCWTCHGREGEGGAGPAIADTRLPLWKFVKDVRLPSEEMPPYARNLASDADLVMVYHWLRGIDRVEAPPPITLALESVAQPRADGQFRADTEVEFTARTAETNLDSDVLHRTPVRYRVTLLARENTPVADRPFEYQRAGREDWTKLTTDQHGQSVLGPDDALIVAAPETGKEAAAARLRLTLPAGRYAFIVEAIDYTDAARPAVLGIGTAIFNVE